MDITEKEWNEIKLKKSLDAINFADILKIGYFYCANCRYYNPSDGRGGGPMCTTNKERGRGTYEKIYIGVERQPTLWWKCFEPIIKKEEITIEKKKNK